MCMKFRAFLEHLEHFYEILRLFINALTGGEKYSVSSMQHLPQIFQTRFSQKQKTFWRFLFHFWNVH